MGRTENASFAKDDVGAARDESPRLSFIPVTFHYHTRVCSSV